MSGGLSALRLDRMHKVLAGHIERGYAPGLATLVSRRGEVHVDTIGSKAFGGTDPIRRDTIFRIASLTKPLAAAAAMILVEECALRLDEPVDRLLPELADRRVLRSLESPVDDTVPANRPITIRDLLTFRSGLGTIFGPPERYPIVRDIVDKDIAGFRPGVAGRLSQDWLDAVGTLPLIHQPGEGWTYNVSATLLGILIARAAGTSLEAVLRERLFEPLGMKDTSFSVPTEKLDRLATAYGGPPDAEPSVIDDTATLGKPPVLADAGGGLVSTLDDYHAFGQMMANHGRCPSGRLLSRPSVQLMTTDQLTDSQKANAVFVPGWWESHGWGFGLSIATKRTDLAGGPGRFGWDGGSGTSWYYDPVEELTGILLTQRQTFPPRSPVWQDFWTSAYAAIDD
ncbi:serine hydrolase [Fodinicola feengrottensis]|uniref:Serine hydrolase n=1 Tax=Fodinicola feengrottensis TaxID=435914 RepID=A0ABN2G4G7_9ACTN